MNKSTKLKKILFFFLNNKKTNLSALNCCEQKELINISEKFLFSGFLLASINFHKSNSFLLEILKEKNVAHLLSYMIKKKDLIKVSKKFNKNKIEFVVLKGMALNIEKIYPAAIRHVRDIDILVKKEDIKKTYEILRKLGFKYANEETQDEANFLYKHHLPPMINKRGTNIELHWRVTKEEHFQNCPLSNIMMKKKLKSSIEKEVFIPDVSSLIFHTIYHGIIHHNLDHGPQFLFDLRKIFEYNNSQWPNDESTADSLNLKSTYHKLKDLIEASSKENQLSNESYNVLFEIFKDFDWSLKERSRHSIFGIYQERLTFKEIFKKVKTRVLMTSYNYQIPLFSGRFFYFLLRDLIISLRKIQL